MCEIMHVVIFVMGHGVVGTSRVSFAFVTIGCRMVAIVVDIGNKYSVWTVDSVDHCTIFIFQRVRNNLIDGGPHDDLMVLILRRR